MVTHKTTSAATRFHQIDNPLLMYDYLFNEYLAFYVFSKKIQMRFAGLFSIMFANMYSIMFG